MFASVSSDAARVYGVRMPLRRIAILPALWLAGVALDAREAQAHCGDDCTAPLPYTLGPTSDVLAPDSVLVYRIPDGRAASALPFFTLTVTDAEGVPVEGSVEVDSIFSLIVWRPAAPWLAGTTYTATSHIDTAAWATAEYGAPPDACHTYDIPVELTVDAAPLPAPAAPPVLVETEHTIVDSDSLDALVCCDGALPYRSYGPGSCPSLETQDDGRCASLRRLGGLAVHHTLDRSALSPAASGNLVSRVIGGTPAPRVFGGVRLYAPECVRLEILDVARGDIFVDERCLGDDIADQLGDIAVDPTAKLAEICEGQAYTCEVVGFDRWDATRCKTWPEGADFEVPAPVDEPATTTNGGCAAGERPPAWLLAGLLCLVPRRRRRAAA
jgi:hypothetical protein